MVIRQSWHKTSTPFIFFFFLNSLPSKTFGPQIRKAEVPQVQRRKKKGRRKKEEEAGILMSLLPRNDPSAQQSNPLHTQMKCTNEAGRAGGRGLGFPLSRSPAFPRPCHVRHADKVGALTWDHDVLVVRAVRSLLGMSLGSSRWALHKSLRPTGEGFATLALTSVKRLTGQMPQAIA